MKSSEVSIKTRSTPASLSFKGQATKHTTVKWLLLTLIWYFLFADDVIVLSQPVSMNEADY